MEGLIGGFVGNLRAKRGVFVEMASDEIAVFSGGDTALAVYLDAARPTRDLARHVRHVLRHVPLLLADLQEQNARSVQ